MTALLDVNCLIALIDEGHVHHPLMQRWCLKQPGLIVATCPLTQNGFIRIVSQQAYGSRSLPVGQAVEALAAFTSSPRLSHAFWPDDISLLDRRVFLPEALSGSSKVTDLYLLGLAHRRQGQLVSLDRSLPFSAIQHGSADLIVIPSDTE